MMGFVVQRESGLGFAPAIAALIPASGPAAPIVGAIVGAVMLGVSIYKFFSRGDPRKVPDTQVVEAAQRSFNEIWFAVSGERFTSLFAPEGSLSETNPDALPYGRTGNPDIDIDAALAAADATYRDAVAHLMRPESVENINGNYGPLLARLQAVKNARAGAGPLGALSKLPAWAPWALGGLAVVVFTT